MFIQLSTLLTIVKALKKEIRGNELPDVRTKEIMTNKIIKRMKFRTEKARSDFTLKTCRIANHLENLMNIREQVEIKNRILRTMWYFFEIKFSKQSIGTWQMFCDCQNYRNN